MAVGAILVAGVFWIIVDKGGAIFMSGVFRIGGYVCMGGRGVFVGNGGVVTRGSVGVAVAGVGVGGCVGCGLGV